MSAAFAAVRQTSVNRQSAGSTLASSDPRILQFDGGSIELRVAKELAPAVIRALGDLTPLDQEVDALDIPTGPIWLKVAVRYLRWYRRHLARHLGNRCVFEPSCSRYAELAFRNRGFWTGGRLTIGRLRRCRPGNGGVDVPTV